MVPHRCPSQGLGPINRRNASLIGVDSSEHADMIEVPTHRRVPPAKRLCTPRRSLSKTVSQELNECAGLKTVRVECVGCAWLSRWRPEDTLRVIKVEADIFRLSADEHCRLARNSRRLLPSCQGQRTFQTRIVDGRSQTRTHHSVPYSLEVCWHDRHPYERPRERSAAW